MCWFWSLCLNLRSLLIGDFVFLRFGCGTGGSGGGGAGSTFTPAEVQAFNAFAALHGYSAQEIAAFDARLTSVPEPSGVCLLGLAAAATLRRRRRPR